MLTRSMRADLGVMISASHNPYDDNGIKLFGPDGYKLSDEIEKQIEELIDVGPEPAARRLAEDRPRQAHRRRAGPLHRIRQAHAAARDRARRPARRGRLRQRRRLQAWRRRRCGSSAPKSSRSASSRTASTSTRNAARPRPEALCQQGARDARRHRHRARRRRRPRASIVDEKGHVVDGDQLMARRSPKAGREDRPAGQAGGVVATVMSNLGLERYLEELGLEARAHAGRRPLCARAHARARLQSRRRAVRPHHHVRLHDHRRRLRRGAAGARGGQEARQAGVRGLPPLRAAAADPEERPLPRRRAARGCAR